MGADQRPLHDCLESWGQHPSQIAIFTALQGKLGEHVDLLCLDKLGHAHRHLGNYLQAQKCHEVQLKLAQDLGDHTAEMSAYWGLCTTCSDTAHMSCAQWHGSFGTGTMARSYFQRYYALADQLGDIDHQARALYQWGRTYRYQIASKQGIPFLNRALALVQTLPDRALEARTLTELGSAHFFARHHTEAQRYLNAAIALKDQTYQGQGPKADIWAELLLTLMDFLAENIDQGYQGLKRIMGTYQAIHDVSLELFALHNIAVCLSQYSLDRDAAISYSQKALDLAQRFGFLRVMISNAANLAVLHSLQHNNQAAQTYLQQAIALYHNYHPWLDREEKGIFLAYTAHAYWLQGQRLRGLFNLGRALVMLPPWSSVNGQLIWRKAVATLTPSWLRSRTHLQQM